MMKQLRVVIITGLSGSGKSTALRALEDIGFFCVDNLPVALLPKFLSIQSDPAKEIAQVAMVMDLRERGFLEKYKRIFTRLREKGYRIEILFFDATDEAILHRFSETRRVSPSGPARFPHGRHRSGKGKTCLAEKNGRQGDSTPPPAMSISSRTSFSGTSSGNHRERGWSSM